MGIANQSRSEIWCLADQADIIECSRACTNGKKVSERVFGAVITHIACQSGIFLRVITKLNLKAGNDVSSIVEKRAMLQLSLVPLERLQYQGTDRAREYFL